VRYLKPMAAITVLAAISSSVSAQTYSVLVEPLNAVTSGTSTAPIFQGTLQKPPQIVLSSADGKTAGQVLDLSQVLVIYFPTERVADLTAKIETNKTALEKAIKANPNDKAGQDALVKAIVDWGTEKAKLLLTGTKVVTKYKTGLFNGALDETKYKVKFLIEKKPASATDLPDPPVEYTQEQLKAIYFLPPTAPAKAGKFDAPDDGRGDAWTAIAQVLDQARQERHALAKQYTHLARQQSALADLHPLVWDAQFQPTSQYDLLKKVCVQLDELKKSIHLKDLLIEAYQIQLVYLPRPTKATANLAQSFWQEPKVAPIAKASGDCCKLDDSCSLEKCAKDAKLRTWSYRFKGAANFPQPLFSSDGDRHDVPGTIIYEGMQLIVASDGRYEVAFTATTPRVPVTLRLELAVLIAGHEPICLSLPAISMVPDYRSADEDMGGAYRVLSNNYQQNWSVRHIGYSPEMAEAAAQVGSIALVQRDGVARFGSLPLSR
jgi:hypothetical protein